MLRETWLWLRARCAMPARKMGHLAEAIALDARAKRQQSHWQEHLACTRAAILQVASQCPATDHSLRCAVILGSGSCHDVPVAELAILFDQVLLVDIVHLPDVRARIKAFANVKMVEADLTGMVEWLVSQSGPINAEQLATAALPIPAVLQQPGIAFVASVNLLSQLPVKPIEYLQQRSPHLTVTELNAFAWRLLRAHVEHLQQLEVPVCLVTDDIQRTWDRRGELVEHSELLAPLGLTGQIFSRWNWPLAPRGELADDHHAAHEVAALRW